MGHLPEHLARPGQIPRRGKGVGQVELQPPAVAQGLVELAVDELPDGRARLEDTYPSAGGRIDLSPFFDLLGVHELAHIFIEADGRVPSRLWVLELACNVLLHAFVAAEEPSSLPTLETFPDVFAGIPASRFTHRNLDDFERSYAHGMDGANYGWFQAKLHVAAKHIHDSGGGAPVIRALWAALTEERSGDLKGVLAEHLGAPAVELLRELTDPAPADAPRAGSTPIP